MRVINPLFHFDSPSISEEQRLRFNGVMTLGIRFCVEAE